VGKDWKDFQSGQPRRVVDKIVQILLDHVAMLQTAELWVFLVNQINHLINQKEKVILSKRSLQTSKNV
jgi:hypothetical protein